MERLLVVSLALLAVGCGREEAAGPSPMEQAVLDVLEKANVSPVKSGPKLDPSALKSLITKLKHEDQKVRESAAKKLAQIGDKQALEPAIAALNDQDPQVRRMAATVLGDLGDPRAVEPLTEAIKDQERAVRHSAAQALGRLGDQRAVDPLVAALRDMAGSVREDGPVLETPSWARRDRARRAAKTLDALVSTGAAAVEPLTTTLRDGNATQRALAAVGLGELGDQRAVGPLNAALNDDDERVRRWAVAGLRKLGENR